MNLGSDGFSPFLQEVPKAQLGKNFGTTQMATHFLTFLKCSFSFVFVTFLCKHLFFCLSGSESA